jgi:hypothetical protein
VTAFCLAGFFRHQTCSRASTPCATMTRTTRRSRSRCESPGRHPTRRKQWSRVHGSRSVKRWVETAAGTSSPCSKSISLKLLDKIERCSHRWWASGNPNVKVRLPLTGTS